MGGMADSPYNKQPLPPEIACVLTADIQPQPDGSTQLTAEFAVANLHHSERMLDIVVPAGELLVVRYMQLPGDDLLPLGERLDIIGGDIHSLDADSFVYDDVKGQRVPTALLVLDTAREKQRQQYPTVRTKKLERAHRLPVLAPHYRELSHQARQVARRRAAVELASLSGDIRNRRANVAADLLRMADVDYVQGIFEPETAHQRIPQLYYGYED